MLSIGRRAAGGSSIPRQGIRRKTATTDAGTLPEILRERVPRTSPAVDLRLIRDDAAGSLQDPAPVITSDQTIHKANAARGRRWKSEQKDIFGQRG